MKSNTDDDHKNKENYYFLDSNKIQENINKSDIHFKDNS